MPSFRILNRCSSYLGERSAGHQDPGATSSFLILQALLESF
ncbi:MAG: DAK2 domain-containing protein [Xenococcus sp. MO_188.B8]|nr:DAK2 domain-containing protein [Xenococcus sp. MO_188.B8]